MVDLDVDIFIIFISVFQIDVVPIIIYIATSTMLAVLGYNCLAGTVVDVCVSNSLNSMK